MAAYEVGRRALKLPVGQCHRHPLCRLVQQHAASFIARTEASTGADLPRFIKDE